MIQLNTTLKGAVYYEELLSFVADGTSDILGYVNLKNKIESSVGIEHIHNYRDKVSAKGRIDRFILPDNLANREHVKSYSQKETWQKTFKPRYIPEKLFNLNCDMYTWDDKVGIATFNTDDIEVIVYDNLTTCRLLQAQLELLWAIALPEKIFFGPRTSLLTQLENEMYLSGKSFLDITDGSPHEVNPEWIIDLQNNKKLIDIHSVEPIALIDSIKDFFIKSTGLVNAELTPTATYAFCLACDTLVETPGDEFIIVDPGFDSYGNLIRSFGGNVVYADRGDNYAIDIDDIIKHVTERTVGIVLIYPDNPFGKVVSKSDLQKLVDFCTKKQVPLLIDNSFIGVDPYETLVPQLKDTSFEGLTYMLMSDTGKILGLQGSKFGCLHFSDNLSEKLHNKIPNYFFQFSQLDLVLISSILTDPRFPLYMNYLNDLILQNFNFVKEHLDSKIKVMQTDATSLCILDITETGYNDVNFADLLKKHHKLGVVPISFFFSGQNQVDSHLVRIALARPKSVIEEAVKRMNNFLSTEKIA